ncbi:head GIN domain-containing protein [Maribacter sp. 4G9]|uniref:head GIN domain-containing protein n=1 Tax=Maribacter sp. 4G9 TaxID=1889777 RepID=UPI000C152B8D|nr:head GIN domain-containing protein [Maribacter sp. 4G9]PIB39393.1 chaperonin [Maribacter sp. 4G9]
MKHFVIILSLFFGYSSFAQDNEITQNLGKFAEVKGFDGISINLIRSSENRAVISGENTDKVAIVNNDGILKIRMQITKFFSGYKTFVDLYYTEDIMVIDVNEDARITSKNTIVQDVLELKSQKGGEVNVSTEVEQLLIKSVSGGIVKASGVANLQDVQINTGGVYEGKLLKTKFSTVNVNAGSRAEIYASEYVKAAVKAGGEVLVYGNPLKLEEKTVFGGSIKRM